MLALLTASLLPALAFGAPHASPASPPAPAHTLNPSWKFQHRLPTTPGQVLVYNFCEYDLSLWTAKGAPAGQAAHIPEKIKVPAGSAAEIDNLNPLCGGSCGVSVKVSKTEQQTNVTQFEYSVDANSVVWYDISLIDCVNGKDASKCPGWESGLLATAGEGFDPTCQRLECGAKEVCEKSAYFESLDLIPGAAHPVRSCTTNWGLSFAACAKNIK